MHFLFIFDHYAESKVSYKCKILSKVYSFILDLKGDFPVIKIYNITPALQTSHF